MTEKELRRLSRAELLEMLLEQTEENRKLKRQLKKARAALSDRKITVEKAGTMAEAALKLNKVFEAADKAARQYLENLESRAVPGYMEDQADSEYQADVENLDERYRARKRPGERGEDT